MKKQYIVTIEIPEGYNINDGADYIRDAVRSWSGQYSPEDSAFDFGYGATVKPIKHTLPILSDNATVKHTKTCISPRFKNTFCSQCGREFGPGDHGYSHCKDHMSYTSDD